MLLTFQNGGQNEPRNGGSHASEMCTSGPNVGLSACSALRSEDEITMIFMSPRCAVLVVSVPPVARACDGQYSWMLPLEPQRYLKERCI